MKLAWKLKPLFVVLHMIQFCKLVLFFLFHYGSWSYLLLPASRIIWRNRDKQLALLIFIIYDTKKHVERKCRFLCENVLFKLGWVSYLLRCFPILSRGIVVGEQQRCLKTRKRLQTGGRKLREVRHSWKFTDIFVGIFKLGLLIYH